MRVRGTAKLWFVVAGTVGFGCAEATAPDEDVTTVRSALTATFVLPLIEGENPMEVSFSASSLLLINDRANVAEIASPQGGAGRLLNLGVGISDVNAGTALGVQARSGTIVSRPLIQLRTNSRVSGSVYQEVGRPVLMQTGVTITGITKIGPASRVAGDTKMLVRTDTSWTRTLTWPTVFIPTPNLEPGQQPTLVSLAPGAYHVVDVKRQRGIRLTAGEYFFDSLIIEEGAQLAIDGNAGPVFAYVLDAGFIYRGNQFGGANTPGMSVPSFTVITTGGATIERAFSGVVIAPNGAIRYNGASPQISNSTHRGAAFGKSVTLFEDNQLLHYRDPFSFRGFVPNDGTPFIGDRVAVTGGTIKHPVGQDPTDEGHQSESVSAVSRNISDFTIMVGYNDHTTPAPPTVGPIVYLGDSNSLDPRDGTNRTLAKGTSVMGWSYSTDAGRTFNYGGKVNPFQAGPATSILWGDPAVAKSDLDDPNVYYANISGSTARFEANMNANGVLENFGNNSSLVATLDGYCIAKSTDRGRTFPVIGCIADSFQDGTALAVIKDVNFRRQVYVTGTRTQVYWMDGETAAFHPATTIPFPFPNTSHEQHPRMRAFGGLIYIVVRSGPNIIANRLNIANNTWLGQTILATDAGGGGALQFAIPGTIENGPIMAFDFGPGLDGFTKLRVLYGSNKVGGGSRMGLRVRECDLEPTLGNCQTLPANTLGELGQEANPSLRFSGGQWMGAWRKQDGTPPTLIRFVVGRLTNTAFEERTVQPGVVPCTYNGSSGRWGEYDYLDGFGDGRFFAPYGVNGPGCRWRGQWTSDAHLGGSVFRF